MKYRWTQYLVWLALVLPLAGLAKVPERPDPPRLVNDLAGILTPAQMQELEDSLVLFDRATSTQVAVVTLSDLSGYDPADMAFRIGESWGVGHEGKNNGIVILVKPKTSRERGEVYISVGYGLEGVIPDAVANGRIIDREMIPRFQAEDYFGGIMAGTRVIMGLARGEYTAEQYAGGGSDSGIAGGSIIVLIIVLIIVISMMKGGNRKSYNTGSRSLPFWILMGMMNSGKRGGSWSDFSGGRGGFGGFGGGGFGGGGGGFGGFGGGSFGGGGAGGSW